MPPGEARARESRLWERIEVYEREADEAEKILRQSPSLPDVSLFNDKSVVNKANSIIQQQRIALADKQTSSSGAISFSLRTRC